MLKIFEKKILEKISFKIKINLKIKQHYFRAGIVLLLLISVIND